MAEGSTMDGDKEGRLLKAVADSDIVAVTQLTKCVDDLDPVFVRIAYDTAKETGNKIIQKLIDIAISKIEKTKEKNVNGRGEEFQSLILAKIEDDSNKQNGQKICRLGFEKKLLDSENSRILSIGKTNTKANKYILLVGSTGAGKTSLIRSLVNKMYGIRYEDSFRIKIDEEEMKSGDKSQTEKITLYEFNHIPGMSITFNLYIIDTPGLNDTRGLEYDEKMFKNLENFLRNEKIAVEHLNCIGIVTMASAARLTQSQKYIYDGCMRIFGNNIKEIIHIMATFSDGAEPAITDALRAAKVVYKEIHKFNNSSVYLPNDNRLNKLYWDAFEKACDNFICEVQNANGYSLTQTIETLQNRKIIQDNLNKVEENFKNGLEGIIEDIDPKLVECTEKSLNCIECKRTCHKPCYQGYFFLSCKTCTKLSKEGNKCQSCNCHYTKHVSKYQEHKVDIFEKVPKEEIENLKKYLEEIQESLSKLKIVALRPILMSSKEYFDSLLMFNRESEQDDSTKTRIAALEKLKIETENLTRLNEPDQIEQIQKVLEGVEIAEGEVKPKCVIS